jgi:hypothetical protein
VTLDRDQLRRRRMLANEQRFRDYNNRRVAFEAGAVGGDEPVPFLCECGDPGCVEGVDITVNEYVAAHDAPNRFTVKPAHVYPDVESVVSAAERYWVVSKAVAQATS